MHILFTKKIFTNEQHFEDFCMTSMSPALTHYSNLLSVARWKVRVRIGTGVGLRLRVRHYDF